MNALIYDISYVHKALTKLLVFLLSHFRFSRSNKLHRIQSSLSHPIFPIRKKRKEKRQTALLYVLFVQVCCMYISDHSLTHITPGSPHPTQPRFGNRSDPNPCTPGEGAMSRRSNSRLFLSLWLSFILPFLFPRALKLINRKESKELKYKGIAQMSEQEERYFRVGEHAIFFFFPSFFLNLFLRNEYCLGA